MIKQLATLSAAALLSAGLSAPANADFITGTLGFSNGLDSVGNIVSELTLFEIGAPTNASGGTGDFTGVAGEAATSNVDINNPSGNIYVIGGFTFTLTGVQNVTSSPVACSDTGLCGDNKEFVISGVVTGAGFDPTLFLGNFTSNGTCLQATAGGDVCAADSQAGTWSSTIAAQGVEAPVPVPATLALFGLGLIGLGMNRRKKA